MCLPPVDLIFMPYQSSSSGHDVEHKQNLEQLRQVLCVDQILPELGQNFNQEATAGLIEAVPRLTFLHVARGAGRLQPIWAPYSGIEGRFETVVITQKCQLLSPQSDAVRYASLSRHKSNGHPCLLAQRHVHYRTTTHLLEGTFLFHQLRPGVIQGHLRTWNLCLTPRSLQGQHQMTVPTVEMSCP